MAVRRPPGYEPIPRHMLSEVRLHKLDTILMRIDGAEMSEQRVLVEDPERRGRYVWVDFDDEQAFRSCVNLLRKRGADSWVEVRVRAYRRYPLGPLRRLRVLVLYAVFTSGVPRSYDYGPVRPDWGSRDLWE